MKKPSVQQHTENRPTSRKDWNQTTGRFTLINVMAHILLPDITVHTSRTSAPGNESFVLERGDHPGPVNDLFLRVTDEKTSRVRSTLCLLSCLLLTQVSGTSGSDPPSRTQTSSSSPTFDSSESERNVGTPPRKFPVVQVEG